MENEFYTNEEAARLLRVSPKSLNRWRQTGAGPRFFKANQRVLYRRSDLLAWIEANAHQSTAEGK